MKKLGTYLEVCAYGIILVKALLLLFYWLPVMICSFPASGSVMQVMPKPADYKSLLPCQQGGMPVASAHGPNPAAGLPGITYLYPEFQELAIIIQPASQAECKDNTVNFNVSVTGGMPPYTYQWQRKQLPSAIFENFGAPVTSPSSTHTLKVEKVGVSGQNTNGALYRVIVSDQSGSAILISEAAELTVNEISGYAGLPKVNHTICPGDSKSFEILTQGLPPLAYHWIKYESSSSSWQNVTNGSSVSGASSPVITFQEATSIESGRYRVRVVFPKTPEGATCQRTYDTERMLSVIPGIIKEDQTIFHNTVPAPLVQESVPFDNSLGITYQWQSSSDGTSGWEDIPFATAQAFSPPALKTTTYFRRMVISDLCGPQFTNAIKIMVREEFLPGRIDPEELSVCAGYPAVLTATSPTGGSGIYTYEWQQSGDGIQNWQVIEGQTGLSLGVSPDNTTWYRIVYHDGGSILYSNIASITISDPEPPGFTPPGNLDVCVENIFSAEFTSAGLFVQPEPDYFLLKPGNRLLDLDTDSFTDNCCHPGLHNFPMRWRIDFEGNDPEEPSIHGLGQPSEYGKEIYLWGDSKTLKNRQHTITYWLTDCNGNESPPSSASILVRSRPQITNY